jgi:anti-sigma B factor antagonist
VLTDLSFMDSTGLGLLIGAHKRAVMAGGRVALVGTAPHLKGMLLVTGLAKLLPSFDTLDAAWGWLDGQSGS